MLIDFCITRGEKSVRAIDVTGFRKIGIRIQAVNKIAVIAFAYAELSLFGKISGRFHCYCGITSIVPSLYPLQIRMPASAVNKNYCRNRSLLASLLRETDVREYFRLIRPDCNSVVSNRFDMLVSF